jgi:hypothetical protein
MILLLNSIMTPSLDNTILKEVAYPLKNALENINHNDNILIDLGDRLSLIKYKTTRIISNPLNQRKKKRIHQLLRDKKISKNYIHSNIIEKNNYYYPEMLFKAEIEGYHSIEFRFDEELKTYIHSKGKEIISFNLTELLDKKNNETINKKIIITNNEDIKDKIESIIPKKIYLKNIIPFINNNNNLYDNNTDRNKSILKIIKERYFTKKKKKPFYIYFNESKAKKWYEKIVKDIEEGTLIYIGSEEKVSLINYNKDNNNFLNQDGFIISKRAPLLFSQDRFDNFYKDKQLSIDNIKRRQEKNDPIFSKEPELITSDIELAIDHFSKTKFKYMQNILEEFIDSQKNKPLIQPPDGSRYYY